MRNRFSLLLALSLVSAACGGSSDATGSATGPASTTTTETPASTVAANTVAPTTTTTTAPTTTAAPATTEATQPVVGENEVAIPKGAFEPSADFFFFPGHITVAVGTTVTWNNRDGVVHTVTSGSSDGAVGQPDGIFDSLLSGYYLPVEGGENFSYTFTDAGTFAYFCTPHPWMIGTVTVEA